MRPDRSGSATGSSRPDHRGAVVVSAPLRVAGGAGELAGWVEGGLDGQAVGDDVVPGPLAGLPQHPEEPEEEHERGEAAHERPDERSGIGQGAAGLGVQHADPEDLVADRLAGAGGGEPGEGGQFDQDERARRGLEVDVTVGRWWRGDVDAEQLADGAGEDPDQDPVQERGGQAPPEARPRLAGWPGRGRRLGWSGGTAQRLGRWLAGLDVAVAAPGRAGLVLGHGGLLPLLAGKGDADLGFGSTTCSPELCMLLSPSPPSARPGWSCRRSGRSSGGTRYPGGYSFRDISATSPVRAMTPANPVQGLILRS